MEEEKGTNDLLTTKENQDENDDSIGPPLKKRRDGDSEDFNEADFGDEVSLESDEEVQ
jgi:hypothetical protein